MSDVIKRPYSDDDIRAIYRQSKNKKEQVKILADLNCCGVDVIREILNLPPGKKPANKPMVDWDELCHHLDNGAEPGVLAERYGTTIAAINRVHGRREADKRRKLEPANAERAAQAHEGDIKRVRALIDLVKPDDSSEVKRLATLLVREIAAQSADRAFGVKVEVMCK